MFLWKAIRHLFTLLLGVFIGAISGYLMNSFLAATGDYLIFEFTIPGALFRLALSTLYVWQTKPLDVYALLKGILIILAGTVSYFAACCTFFYLVGNANLEDAAIRFVAGGVSTTLLLSGLVLGHIR